MNAEASNNSAKKSLGKRVVERVFPKVPDFFKLLGEQSAVVGVTAGFLVEYMGSSSAEVAKKITECEYEGDRLKVQNLTLLNEAFSTPIDREDIHRAIINLDEIINSCKTIVVEMDADLLGVKADKFCIEMAAYLKEGAEAIAGGDGRLDLLPGRIGVELLSVGVVGVDEVGKRDAVEGVEHAVASRSSPNRTAGHSPSCSRTTISTTSSAARKSIPSCRTRLCA